LAYEWIDEPGRLEVAPGKRIWALRRVTTMTAKYILVILAAGFLIAGARTRRRGGRNPANRTWLLIGTIFALVGLFLFAQS